MNDLPVSALKVLGAHRGVATTTMLREAGVGRNALRRLVMSGVLALDLPGVYRLAGSAFTIESRCVALCLAYRRGFVTGPTTGRLVGLRRMGAQRDIDFCVPHGSNIGPLPGVHLRQSTLIDPAHLQRRRDGIVTASIPRLAFDLGVDLTPVDHSSVIEQILQERRCTPATLRAIGKQLFHPARPGSVQFMLAMRRRLEGGPLESHGEVQIAVGLRARGVPVVAQFWIDLPGNGRARFDLAVPAAMWAVEIDGIDRHFDLVGGTADRRRDRSTHGLGWQVERVTPIDLVDVDATCDELAALYRCRCALRSAA